MEEPGAVTPIFSPLKSAADLTFVGEVLAHGDGDAREAPELDHGADVLTLGLHADGVLIGARHDIDRAADQRLQRLRAAAEIVDLDVEALLLEEALLLRDRQREIVQELLAADAERQLGLLGVLRERGMGRKAECGGQGERSQRRAAGQDHGAFLRLNGLRFWGAHLSRR